jgi:plastocyanin
MLRRRGIVALLAVAAALMALGGIGAARSTKPKVVDVADNYYAPPLVKIHKRGKVRWQWPVNGTLQPHNVTLVQAPRGVKKSKFRSQNVSSPSYAFTKRFRKPGKYQFVCTLHRATMKMDVKVRRPG